MGVEKPDGKKKPTPKQGKKRPFAMQHFDNAKRDTNAPYAHDIVAYQDFGSRALQGWILHASALLCRWMFFRSWSKWVVFIMLLFFLHT